MSQDSKPSSSSPSLTYKDAGVDIDAGNQLVQNIKGPAARTHRPEVLGNIGGFGALCEIPQGYQQPVLVSGTDGVGTKLRIALDMKKHDTVGIDLVAMCVNDLLAIGAEPLFFLDYYATSSLDVDVASEVINGIAKGCELSGCALIGGETAEMPGMYHSGDYDLAGFCVGVVEKSKIIDANKVQVDDALIAIASDGVHSNGFSLVRKIIEHQGASLNDTFGETTLGETLLTPTKLYVKPVLSLIDQITLKGVAHITGGGLTENIPRVLPKGINVDIDLNTWQLPPIFQWLQTKGNIAMDEMLKTFNCGVGLVLVVSQQDVSQALAHLKDVGETAWVIGQTRRAATETDSPSVTFTP